LQITSLDTGQINGGAVPSWILHFGSENCVMRKTGQINGRAVLSWILHFGSENCVMRRAERKE
jgi:hypothetical protein